MTKVSVPSPAYLSSFRRARRALVSAGCALVILTGLSSGARAQTNPEEPKKEISEKIGTGLQQLQPLFDAKKWDEALNLLNDLVKQAKPNTYDRALTSQYKALVLLQKEKYGDAIPPLEEAVRISDRYHFFDERVARELVFYLAQLYNQQGSTLKDPVEKGKLLEKSFSYIKRLIDNGKPKEEDMLFASSLLYNIALLDDKNIDKKKLEEARHYAEEGLMINIKPKDQLYVLVLAASQQLGDNQRAIDMLELLVKQQPKSQTYWTQLASLYLNMADTANKKGDAATAKEYYVRGILTIQRAQANGIMNSPKDNYTLVAIYFNLEQYDAAIALLEKGLHDGSIEGDRNNWQLLASSYQQQKKEFKAIATLTDAAKIFNKDGQFEFAIAQIYYSIDDTENAYKHLKAAIELGGLEKPGGAYVFIAYIGYELRRFEEARDYLEEAAKQPDAKQDDVDRLKRAVNDAIKEREAARNENI